MKRLFWLGAVFCAFLFSSCGSSEKTVSPTDVFSCAAVVLACRDLIYFIHLKDLTIATGPGSSRSQSLALE